MAGSIVAVFVAPNLARIDTAASRLTPATARTALFSLSFEMVGAAGDGAGWAAGAVAAGAGAAAGCADSVAAFALVLPLAGAAGSSMPKVAAAPSGRSMVITSFDIEDSRKKKRGLPHFECDPQKLILSTTRLPGPRSPPFRPAEG